MIGTKITNVYKVIVLCWVTGLAMCGYENTQIIASCLKGYCQNKKHNSEQGQNADGLATPTTVVPILQNKTCPSLDPVGGKENRDGWTPLHEAAYQGRLAVVKCLVQAGADVNANAYSGIPLHLAAKTGNFEVVKYLVEHGGRVDALDGKRYQPLQLAAWYGDTPSVKYLLDKGAIIEHGESWTALHEAANYGFLEIVKLLVEKGGNVNTMTKDGTPVHLAARNGRLEVLKYLVDKGGDVNALSRNGTPLQMALRGNHSASAQFLKSKGAS